MVIAYTACFGETDRVRAPEIIDPAVRYLCFSDRPVDVPPYEWIEVAPEADPRLAARRLKVLAEHPALLDAPLLLWHDASYRLKRPLSWVGRALRAADVVGLRHPSRSLIEDEAVAIARYGYLPIDEAQALVRGYRREGFTADVITASGLLGRRCSPAVTRFAQLWWAEILRWNGRDQASHNYAIWKAGLTVRHLLGTIRQNRYAEWRVAPQEACAC